VVVACPCDVTGVAVEPEVGISGDTQRSELTRNDQVTAGDFNCRDVGCSSELMPVAENDDLRFVSVQLQAVCKNHSRRADEQTVRRSYRSCSSR